MSLPRRHFKQTTLHKGEQKHFGEQKQAYDKAVPVKFPVFAIVQSSGYGKSRLIKYLQAESTKRTISGDVKPMTPKII
jgi:hypothetical protein